MTTILDIVNPQKLVGFTRGIEKELNANTFTLSGLLPNRNILDIDFSITQGTLLDQDMASARSWDTPVPIAGRQGLTKLMGELPPVGRKIRLGEEETIRLNQLLRNGGGEAIIASVYNDVRNMARATAAWFEYRRGEALYKGQININENGVKLDIDFGRAGSHDVAPATLWSNIGASTPLLDELAWLQTYVDTNGEPPVAALTSLAVVRLMQQNTSLKALAAFNGVTPAFLSLEQINIARSTYGLPPVIIYETKVRIAGVQTRVIPASKFIYVPAPGPLGATLQGVTAEAIKLAEARTISQDQLSGMTAVVYETVEPVSSWTKVSAVGVPILANPNLTLVATVTA